MADISGYNGTNRHKIRIDASTRSLNFIDYAHHEVHAGSSFSTEYEVTTAGTDAHRSGIYLLTPATPEIHLIAEFSASAAAYFSICEAPTIAAETGADGVAIFNRHRDSSNLSTLKDNATPQVVDKVSTINEAAFDGDATWATGTVIRTAPLQAGVGPKPAGGSSRGAQEYILKASTAYVFMLTNNGANANAHAILLDWYEHTAKEA